MFRREDVDAAIEEAEILAAIELITEDSPILTILRQCKTLSVVSQMFPLGHGMPNARPIDNDMTVEALFADSSCPKCGGSWPTACSCPAGTVYMTQHGRLHYPAGYPVDPNSGQLTSTFLPSYSPLLPHRRVKLETGHVVCVDCLVGGAYYSVPPIGGQVVDRISAGPEGVTIETVNPTRTIKL